MFPVTALPKPGGPEAVGVRTFELDDPSRPGVFSAAPDAPRRLLLRVWYPATTPAGDARPAPYFSAAEARSTAHGLGELIGFPQLLSHLKHVRANAYENAPLRPAPGKRPVVVYGHGYMSFLGQHTALMEELASHGYIVYSIQHTYDASDTVFPDGDVAPMDTQLKRRHDARRPEGMSAILGGKTLNERFGGHLLLPEQDGRMVGPSAAIWVQDRSFLLDRLAAGEVPEAIADIVAASDVSRTGQIGMSFGGSTTGGFCMTDTRCAAGVNLDGLSYHLQTLNADMPVPFLMLHSELGRFGQPPQSFNQFSYERFETAGLSDHVHRFQIRDALHMGFSDFTVFVRPPLGQMFLGKVPPHTMIGLQKDMVRTFFDRYVRGERNGFPEQVRAAHGDWLVPLDNSNVRHWWLARAPEERTDMEARIAVLRGAGKVMSAGTRAVPSVRPVTGTRPRPRAD
ncbi:alpha/beta hydrolase [Thauera sp. Sel9]|uniref:alpha/beta hydrolase n=1 Tax=Thauera sp. Sel9 TaxID=2974299 RepID=UPI0021E16235|nr:hypothetical protein [Thauera sp. Sel9]MCV2217164.1 hypothetical protein [Thauera sp. Sel9]